MWDTLVKGGPVMVPIIFCSVVGLAVILERLWFFWRTRADGDDLIAEIDDCLRQGKPLEAMQQARQHPGPGAAMLAAGVAYADIGPAELRVHLEQAAGAEIYRMKRGLSLLGAIAAISPLLGLLGTVTGIISSFHVLASLQGLAGSSALSEGIAEALIATAAGLTVAIPALAFYEWFNSIIEHRVQEMNRQGSQFVDIVSDARGEP